MKPNLRGSLEHANLNTIRSRSDLFQPIGGDLRDGEGRVFANSKESRFRIPMNVSGMRGVFIPEYDPHDAKKSLQLRVSMAISKLTSSESFQGLLERARERAKRAEKRQNGKAHGGKQKATTKK